MTVLSVIGDSLYNLLLRPSSITSLSSLGCALALASGFYAWRHWRRRGRAMGLRLLKRALFPVARHRRSHAADVAFAVFNIFGAGMLIGWAILSYNWMSSRVLEGLVGTLGPMPQTGLSPLAVFVLVTLVLFLAHEFAYWLDHYLAHTVPVLWEFHRVHHEAEALTPLTVLRMHPVDSLVYANITALFMGTASGALTFALGQVSREFQWIDGNVLMVLALHSILHLQHSHVWLPITGPLGRVIMSPAHHQLHHSTDPRHFNKNLGAVLCVFDWLFGTLHVPAKEPERLTFGVAQEHPGADPHSAIAGVIAPFARAWGHVAAALPHSILAADRRRAGIAEATLAAPSAEPAP